MFSARNKLPDRKKKFKPNVVLYKGVVPTQFILGLRFTFDVFFVQWRWIMSHLEKKMPAYHNFTTMQDVIKKWNKEAKQSQMSSDQYYSEMLGRLERSGKHDRDIKATTSQILAEMQWENAERPYYSIHPSLVTKLCQVDFSKVPASLIKMPDPYDVITIRLNQQNELLTIEDGKYYLRSMLVWRRQKGDVLKQGRNTFNIDDDVLICWIDFGETQAEVSDHAGPLYTYKCFPIKEGQMIQDAFNTFPKAPDADLGVKVPEEFTMNCIKLFISVGFLAASETSLLAFDILNRDAHKWLAATKDARKLMIARAKKRGKNGWILGTDEMFSSRELAYSHIRAGHPHLYWHGKGKKQIKMRFVAPTTVRRDLKPKLEE